MSANFVMVELDPFNLEPIIARTGRHKRREPVNGEKRSREVEKEAECEKRVRREPIEIGVELGFHLGNTIVENMYDCEIGMETETGENKSPRSP